MKKYWFLVWSSLAVIAFNVLSLLNNGYLFFSGLGANPLANLVIGLLNLIGATVLSFMLYHFRRNVKLNRAGQKIADKSFMENGYSELPAEPFEADRT